MESDKQPADDRVEEMSTPPQDSEDQGMSFADMLDAYQPEPLKRGQLVEGQILKMEDKVFMVDVGAKRTAVIPPDDLDKIDPEILNNLKAGDEVLLYVLRTPVGDDDLLVSLQRGLQQQDWVEAEALLESQELVELEVVGHNKGGLLVDFGHLRGFVPNSHVPELQRIYDRRQLTSRKAKMLEEKLPLKVIEVDRDRKRLVLSAKEAQKEVRQQRLLELEEGEIITGRVTSIVDFGAFVDLGGVDGLIHISNLDWHSVAHPGDVLDVGEEVEVKVESVDVERERIGLSRKALLPNPWQRFDAEHEAGELVEGVVTNVVDFGAFVQIAPGVEGLVHASEMRIYGEGAPQDVLQTGDVVLTRIIRIEPEEERVGLSQKRVNMQEELQWMQRRPKPPGAEEALLAEGTEEE